jgi:hypothetical protein
VAGVTFPEQIKEPGLPPSSSVLAARIAELEDRLARVEIAVMILRDLELMRTDP